MMQLVNHLDVMIYVFAAIAIMLWRFQRWRDMDDAQREEALDELRSKMLKRLEELLLLWVTNAEKKWGAKTGDWKLMEAYDLASREMERLGFGSLFGQTVSLEEFDAMVQPYIAEMNHRLETNDAIANIVRPIGG